ncbi:hypothetical protein BGZ60DRAFT_282835 [Tricladium varicosporioides]|nr:hypothetical protein BGZ60DRAFT_282835 [Hymenoscyphus varicosporioides]
MGERDPEFLQEAWALYGIGAVVLLLRFATRIKTVGFKGFQGDDYMSILVLALFTMDAATVHIIYYAGTNVEAAALQLTRTLTPEEIAQFEFGSKEQLAAWYSYTALIWAMKGTMLFFFDRLTIGLWQHRYVKWLSVGCILSYIAVVLTLTFGCFPTQKNWQVVPDPGRKCTLKLQNFLVTVVLNVLTDAAILVIPVPLLWGLKVPLKKKLIIGLLLCSGTFVIAAAIIRVVLTLGSNPSALNINRWGVRETIVGIITINLPILKPLFNPSFWSTSSFKSSSLSHGHSHNLENLGPYQKSSRLVSSTSHKGDAWDVEAGSASDGKSASKSEESFGKIKSSAGSDRDSQVYILQGKDDDVVSKGLAKGDVLVETTYQVRSESVGRGGGAEGWSERLGGASRVSVRASERN